MLKFTGERIVPGAENCHPLFALKMYQEHSARYLFAAQFCAGKRVLDVACGVGYGSQLLARKGAAQVVAFDLSEEAVHHAQIYYSHPKLEFLVGSAEKFLFSRRFDVVVCFELIEHVHHPHRTLQCIADALAPGGVLIMSTPRSTGEKRSAFHTRELTLDEFSALLETYFEHVHFFFENNHFSSLIASAAPEALRKIHCLHPQFSLGQADSFVAVASSSTIDREIIEPQLVLNDDGYVRDLEKDVDILHRAETDRAAQIRSLSEQNAALAQQNSSLAAQVAENARKIEGRALADREQWNQEIRRSEAAGVALYERLLETEGRLSKLQAQLNDALRRQELSSLETQSTRRELEDLTQVFDIAKKRLALVERWWTSLHTESINWRRQLEDEKKIADSFRRQVAELHHSASWRITAPLRRILDMFLGLRRTMQPQSGPGAGQIAAEGPSEALDILYLIGCQEGESKRYRVHNIVEGLQDLGFKAKAIVDSEVNAFIESRVPARCVVLFRCGDTEASRALMADAKNRAIPLGFDVDDLIFEPESIEFVRVVSTFGPLDRAQYLSGVNQYRRMLLAADFVTCPTSYLAGHAEKLGKKALVIPNTFNRRQHELAIALNKRAPNQDTTIRIGYFSGSNTHQIDFQMCETALLWIMERHPQCRFVLVGILTLGPRWDSYKDRVERFPFLPYEQMLETLAQVDINLAPLEIGNPYCEAKSPLKIFEAGLVQVPTLASRTSSYRQAIDHGEDGFLAGSETEWVECLELLVSDGELRKKVGRAARERALHQFSHKTVGRAAAMAYGLLPPAPERPGGPVPATQPTSRIKISWIVPGLMIGGGGHRNILRAAYHLHRFGHQIELYFTSTDLSEAQLAETIRTHFYPLSCPVYRYNGTIAPTDVLFATHWSTVDAAVRAKDSAGELMYFVQDFEPAFSPMGSEYILAENTYRLGLYHITSGPWCEQFLRNEFGCDADHFLFPVDREIYYARARTKTEKNILFFAKPEMPRRCFELGVMALEQIHRIRPDVEIILFGSSHLETTARPFPATILSLLPRLEDLANLYANADAGIVFSTTNPSLVPYEMMACGLAVVDLGRPGNEINYGRRRDIALLADPVPSVMARQICELLDDDEARHGRSRNGLQFVASFPTEEEMARRVEDLIVRRLRKRGYQTKAETLAVHA